MGNSCMTGAECATTVSETKIYPYCLYWLFEIHALWRDTLLSLDIAGRTLDLSQSNVLDFIDSPMGSLTLSESGGGKVGGKEEGTGGGEEVGTGVGM